MTASLILLVLTALLSSPCAVSGQVYGSGRTLEVDTPSGRVRGEKYRLPGGAEGVRFLGVPYGRPPVEEFRFKAPVPAEAWKGTLDATSFGPMCQQYLGNDFWDMEVDEMYSRLQEEFLSKTKDTAASGRITTKFRRKRNVSHVVGFKKSLKEATDVGSSVPEGPGESEDKSHPFKGGPPRYNRTHLKDKAGPQEDKGDENSTALEDDLRSAESSDPAHLFAPPDSVLQQERQRNASGGSFGPGVPLFDNFYESHLFSRLKYVHQYNISEDCLSLNIYMPLQHKIRHKWKHHEKLSLPVLFYVHGGSFFLNGGRLYPGEKLASEELVVVTINYRLGPFGFLSTGDRHASGNWGLLDQRLALEWVQGHIESFSGDPKRVLLVGNSAGGASVLFHMLSPLSTGLFSRVAALSGCSLAPWALQKRPLNSTRRLAKQIGCPTRPISALMKCLRKLPAQKIVNGFTEVIQDGLWLSFAPVIEGTDVEKPFLPGDPRKIILQGGVAKVPLVMTLTKDEVSIWFERHQSEISLRETESWIDMIIQKMYPGLEKPSLDAVSQSVRAKYIYDHLGYDPYETANITISMKTMSDLISDIGLRVPCVEEALLLSRRMPLYFAEFSYSSQDDIRLVDQKWIGAYHESELQYLFGQPYFKYANNLRHPLDAIVSLDTMQLFRNFADKGKPEVRGVKWPQFSEVTPTYLEVGASPQARHNILQKRISFWLNFLPLLTKYKLKPIKSVPNDCYIFSICPRAEGNPGSQSGPLGWMLFILLYLVR